MRLFSWFDQCSETLGLHTSLSPMRGPFYTYVCVGELFQLVWTPLFSLSFSEKLLVENYLMSSVGTLVASLHLTRYDHWWAFLPPVQNLPGWENKLVDIVAHTCRPPVPLAPPGRGPRVPGQALPPSAASSQLTGSAAAAPTFTCKTTTRQLASLGRRGGLQRRARQWTLAEVSCSVGNFEQKPKTMKHHRQREY